MKIPFSWLKEFVPLRASADEVANKLTFAGLEVEGIEDREGEKILEINVTPNRGDCLSVLGIAREWSALLGIPLKKRPTPKLKPSRSDPLLKKAVTVAKPGLCPRYQLAVIEGVKVGPSPDWLVRRLSQVGIRSINNIVDVTNYVLIELGQPLHAFDRTKLRGGKVVVRCAREGEKIRTLDGQERELKSSDLVIADAEGPIALAGIMGGKDSEVDGATTSVALECAFFDPSGIRKTARRLGIQTESSYRFERRVDPSGLPAAMARAVSLILELAGGQLVGPLTDLKKGSFPSQKVLLRPAHVASHLGGTWDKAVMKRALQRLSFSVQEMKADRWSVGVPSYRGDIQRPEDLMEEIARLSGYDRIPRKFPAMVSPPPREGGASRLTKRVKELLVDLGFREMIHYSFMSPQDLHGVFAPKDGEGIFLKNPLGEEFSLMRPSLLPLLLKAAAHHQNHKMSAVRAFELRSCFRLLSGQVAQRKFLAGVLSGPRLHSHWSVRGEETDFFDLKGVVERVLGLLGVEAGFEKTELSALHPRRQAGVKAGDTKLGLLGEIHPDLAPRFGLHKPVYAFEIDWETACALGAHKELGFQSFSRTPVVERDLALVLDDAVPAGILREFLRTQDPAVQEVAVFDLYRGNPIPQGKKSLAFSIRIGRKDRTLTEQEVNGIYGRLVEGVKQQFGAEVR